MKKTFIFILGSLMLLSFVPARAQEQGIDPGMFITWRSHNYVPPGFAGRPLPVPGSVVTASFELIRGGRANDVSGEEIFWYLDSDLLQSGRGLKKATFQIPERAGGFVDLRVEIPNSSDGYLVKTVEVPVAAPEVVLNGPFPGGRFSGSEIKIGSLVYFLNSIPAGLSYSWNVNGSSPKNVEDPDRLVIRFPGDMKPGFKAEVYLMLSGRNGERVTGGRTFIYSP